MRIAESKHGGAFVRNPGRINGAEQNMILFLLPESDYDPTEAGVPWAALRAAGIRVKFATPRGDAAFADPRLTDTGFSWLSPLLMTRNQALIDYREMTQDTEFQSPTSYDDVDVASLQGVFVPGGHAVGVRSLLEHSTAQKLFAHAMLTGIPVGAVCHGVLLGVRSINPETGRSVLYGRRTTALTAQLELTAWNATRLWLGSYYRTYSTTVQAEVTAALAHPSDFERGPLFPRRDGPTQLHRGFTVQDGNYVSARWPGDCHRLAHQYRALVQARLNSGGESAERL